MSFEGREEVVALHRDIFVRPLPALATLFATLPPRVSTRRRGRLHGTVAGLLAQPLALALRAADRLVPKFL